MHERALRTVLLIQAIDESDPEGELLSLAERAEATRAAAQSTAGSRDGASQGSALPRSAERLLVRRAEYLLPRLQARAPVVAHMLMLARGGSWLAPALLGIAFVSGVSLSALDGNRRIDLLAFPLLGLILWNALVYAVLLGSALRRRGGAPGRAWLPRAYERWLRGRADALMRRSSRFNQPLSAALQRFARDFSAVARPLLVLRGRRIFHLCAALVALGLITGLYVRGIVLRYDAGWDSTFLAPGGVRVLLHALYGPASALSGIALPDSVQAVEALRWRSGASAGAPAAPWIHLIALTALLYIVLPRLAAALWASARLFARARHPTLPASLLPYARAILRQSGGAVRLSARVTSYAYEPPPDALAGLATLLSDALGGDVALERAAAVGYGGEDAFAARLHNAAPAAADCHVLLMSLAATPEAENHGRMLSAMREELAGRLPRCALLVLIDEAPYAARMRGDASFERRMDERRQAWRGFVARHGLEACIADLGSVHAGRQVAEAERAGVLTALQWPAS